MIRSIWSRRNGAILAWIAGALVATGAAQQVVAPRWETSARLHGALLSKDSGTLVINESGVEFRPEHGDTKEWTFLDIHSFSIAPHQLLLQTFTNRSLHRPGEKSYRFDLDQAVPPTIATFLAKEVSRPSRNTTPNPRIQDIASIPARHRRLIDSTNGVLRFQQEGIQYISGSLKDSRSWRWADLQAISEPDPYHLSVFGYRDTYTFDLKAPLSRKLFDWATDEIFLRNEPADEPAATKLNEPENHRQGEDHE